MFTDLRIPAGRRPMTDSEARISAAIGLAITLLFIAAIFEEYSPKKLSIVFYILFWVPMLVVHELGHALAARALGWRVREIVIGFGRTLWQWQTGETRIKVKLAPIEGYVLPAPADAKQVRLKTGLIYAAGPGAELAVLAIMIAFFGWETVFNDSSDVSLVALKTLAVVILVGAGFNLLPFRTDGAVSDGLGILSSPFMTRDVIDMRLLTFELREVQSLLDAGETSKAMRLLGPLLDRFPDNVALQLLNGTAISRDGRTDDARALAKSRLADAGLGEITRREWLKLQATIELNAPDPHFMTLDLAVQEALRITPDAPDLLAIKGASLVLRGDYEAGGNLLAHAWRKGGDRDDDPLMLAFLSVAAVKVGDRAAADHFREAFELTNRSVALRKTVTELTA
jgi:hypothetical protein